MSTLKEQAQIIRDETLPGANTAQRIGDMFVNLVDEVDKKLSKESLAQGTGSSTTTAMSQKAVTKEVSEIRNNLFRHGSGGYLPWEQGKKYNDGDVVISPDGQLVECIGGTSGGSEYDPGEWAATTIDELSKKRDAYLSSKNTRLEQRCDAIEDNVTDLNDTIVQNKEETDTKLSELEEKINDISSGGGDNPGESGVTDLGEIDFFNPSMPDSKLDEVTTPGVYVFSTVNYYSAGFLRVTQRTEPDSDFTVVTQSLEFSINESDPESWSALQAMTFAVRTGRGKRSVWEWSEWTRFSASGLTIK